jgi:hypothetical protein
MVLAAIGCRQSGLLNATRAAKDPAAASIEQRAGHAT